MQVRKVGEALGAEVQGADLCAPSAGEVKEIWSALLEHEVLFFRETGLDDESHMALAARFGQPSVFPMTRLLGETEPSFQVIADGPESPPGTDYWHTDVTWTAEPPKAAFLRAVVMPETGGDTLWGSMTAAYEALSPPVRRFFETLSIRHDNTSFIEGMFYKIGEEAAAQIAEGLRAQYPPVEHPLVRTHPETGRKALLFGGHFMRAVVGLEANESEALIEFLWKHVDQPRFHVRWSWRPGDLAIWDERSTVHRALSDHFPQRREVRRCVIDGDRPF
jgi:taurine dioxygenase